MMDLTDENRIMVKEGLRMLPKLDNPGLTALFEENGIDMASVSAYHIGFIIGPCLNASGRLYTANLALQLLLTKDQEEAKKIAAELVELNVSRKAMTEQGVREAQVMIETSNLKKDKGKTRFWWSIFRTVMRVLPGLSRDGSGKTITVRCMS